mmetsp:Transcript_29327/g.44387  ORF Transcript_29327/g.44387 Transcript_29327/m.44387 type:complete len:763 (-) Transcript_29327:238-2526(-)
MKKIKEITSYFDNIIIFNKETNLTKTLDNTPVTLGLKDIYVGTKCNWKYKWNKVIHVHTEHSTVDIETDVFHLQLKNADPENWIDFHEFLQRRWKFYCEKAGRKEAKIKHHTSAVSTTSWTKKTKPTKMYGSRSTVKSRQYKSVVINPETEWSDDGKDILGLSEEEKEVTTEQGRLHNVEEVSATSREEPEDEEYDSTSPECNLKRNLKRPRLRKKTRNDDDSDDDVFDDPKITTLLSNSKIVTPRPKAELRFEDDDSEVETRDVETNQKKVSAFFRPKTIATRDKSKVTTSRENEIGNFPNVTKKALTPLKQNNEKWIENRPKLTPTSPVSVNNSKNVSKDVTGLETPKTSKFFSSRREEIEDISDSENELSLPKRRKLSKFATPSKTDTALTIKTVPKSTTELRTKTFKSSVSVLVPSWRGLKNLGNSCYLNASLQLLFTLPDLVSSLVGHGSKLCQSITSVSNSLRNATQASINPRCVKIAVDAVTDRFLGYEQRDAHEFLSDLIDRVHDELIDEAAKVTSDNAGESVITDDFFRTDVEVCLKCNTCGYERTMGEMYRHLSIEVDRHQSCEDEDGRHLWKVEDGLKRFFLPTQLEAKCEKCKKGTSITRENKIASRPRAFILQLKRFVVKEKIQIRRSNGVQQSNDSGDEKPPAPIEMIISKNKDPVLIPESFDLRDMAEFNASLQVDSVYKLKGVIHHHGGTPSSGHYTADVIRTNSEGKSEWVSFDDGHAHPSNLSKLLKNPKNRRTSYLLLYTVQG